eukprot:GHVU01125556.1.p1 GENE.GHVU01125556.1~~GHVU01125556.1.p1  ORF type:complete len:154 (+),score=8.27 GHVU01125556.1:79-540(+)
MYAYISTVVILLCVLQGAVCQVDCTGQPDGVYGHGCRSYTLCQNGAGTQVDCMEPTPVYNQNIQQCDTRGNTPPPCGYVFDCSQLLDGSYPDMSRNCTSFYTCINGAEFGSQHCAPGTVFDTYEQICNWPSNVPPPCGTKEEEETSTETTEYF